MKARKSAGLIGDLRRVEATYALKAVDSKGRAAFVECRTDGRGSCLVGNGRALCREPATVEDSWTRTSRHVKSAQTPGRGSPRCLTRVSEKPGRVGPTSP